jgi:ABC-type lipoprotein release transport system permease subunit
MRLVARYNLRNLFVRRSSTAMTLFGISMVVAVFVVLMALARGLRSVGESTGDPLTAIVIQGGTNAETSSGISDETADRFEDLPQVPRDERGPAVSRDLFVVLNLPRPDGGPMANVIARGVTDRAFELRPEVRVDGGKRPRGSEIVVGRPLASRFANLNVGDTVRFCGRDWTVAAHFDAGGSSWESEIWADLRELGAGSKRENACSSLHFRLNRPEDLKSINDALAASKDLNGLKADTLRHYHAAQTQNADILVGFALAITAVLSFGAGLGAMNTMYAAIGARAREIGTLRALGFSRRAVLFAFLCESALIGAAGGVIGCLVAMPVNGLATGTANWITFAEQAFSFRITPGMLAAGVVLGAGVGAIGGFLPALAAARRPIVASLRAA